MGVLPRTRRRRICDSRNLSSPSVAAGQPLSVKLHGSCTREDGLDRTRPSPGSAAIGFGGGVWAGQGAVPSPVEGPMSVTRTRASRCRASCAAGSHAGSHADERPSSSSDLHEQRARTRPRSRTDLNGSGSPYGSYKTRLSRPQQPTSPRRCEQPPRKMPRPTGAQLTPWLAARAKMRLAQAPFVAVDDPTSGSRSRADPHPVRSQARRPGLELKTLEPVDLGRVGAGCLSWC